MQRYQFSTGDALSAGVLAGLGAYIIIEARRWVYVGPEGPGPGFFPTWYGIAMVVLSLAIIVARLYSGAKARSGRVKWREVGTALVMWLAFAACVALLKVLGFLLAFGLFTLLVVSVLYRRRWTTGVAVAVGSAAGFYVLFPLALNVQLPVGVFGF